MLSRFQSQQQNLQNSQQENNISFISYENERVAVRRNFLESLKVSLHESFVTNIGLVCLSSLKIIAIILVFIFEKVPKLENGNQDLQLNEKQLQGVYEIKLWLIFMIAYDGLNIFYLFYTIYIIGKYNKAAYRRGQGENSLQDGLLINNDQQDQAYMQANQMIQSQISLDMEQNIYQNGQNDMINEPLNEYQYQQYSSPLSINHQINFLELASNRNKILKYSSLATKISYLVLFLLGNYFAYINKSCSSQFPYHYYLLLWLVALGYFSFGIQILLLLSICLCFPLTLFLYVLMRNRTNSSIPANNEIIKRLQPQKYKEKINNSEFDTQKECCICLVDYQPDDLIISLPCSKLHHYHYDCVVKWLNISGVCPICKKPLEQYVQELEDVKQNYQFY
ncbi:hypothetical protein ABPG74_021360 [Tetrahymena malaccensis]